MAVLRGSVIVSQFRSLAGSGLPYVQPMAFTAAMGLIVIQIGIGVILKSAQKGGAYTFSTSASITISEFFKFLLSASFFFHEFRRRMRREADNPRYADSSPSNTIGAHSEEDDDMRQQDQDDDAETQTSNLLNPTLSRSEPPLHHRGLGLAAFWGYLVENNSLEAGCGFYVLALGYTLINNSVFLSYKLADPGTIQLVKSGGTLTTALIMVTTLGRPLSKRQWQAVFVQLAGLIMTQYQPGRGTAYPLFVYFVLFVQLCLSSSSGVYNQHLAKLDNSSLHANNMVLYGSGALVNALSHFVIRIVCPDEPSFFTGYDSFSAVMVIVSNVFIGLAITAVYKYADAIIKCIATAVSTSILLYISSIFFGTELGIFVIPGTIIIFGASWVYIATPPPPKPSAESSSTGGHPVWGSLNKYLKRGYKNHRLSLFSIFTFATVVLVACLSIFQTRSPDQDKIPEQSNSPSLTMPEVSQGVQKDAKKETERPESPLALDQFVSEPVLSPLRNVMAMIRWNSQHRERIPLLMKYEPFFDTIHLSMPEMMEGRDKSFFSWTMDQSTNSDRVYAPISDLMSLMLARQPHLQGLMYFHFDAWVDPLKFDNMDLSQIWFPQSPDPPFICMDNIAAYDWWRWDNNVHTSALAAIDEVKQLKLGYQMTPGEWCIGWTDVFYIPRQYFADFIVLSSIFDRHDVFLEVAIPTIIQIIDRTRRKDTGYPTYKIISDCWGSCCASDPTPKDVTWNRCGHRLNYLNETVTNEFYNRLDSEAKLLTSTRKLSVE